MKLKTKPFGKRTYKQTLELVEKVEKKINMKNPTSPQTISQQVVLPTVDEIIENYYPKIDYEDQYGTEIAVIKFDAEELKQALKQKILSLKGLEEDKMQGDYPYEHKYSYLEAKLRNELRKQLIAEVEEVFK